MNPKGLSRGIFSFAGPELPPSSRRKRRNVDPPPGDFEGSHLPPLSTLLTDAFHASGIDLLAFVHDSSDEYELRVRRKDDEASHFLALRFRPPVDVEGAWRLVRRAERWLRSPRAAT